MRLAVTSVMMTALCAIMAAGAHGQAVDPVAQIYALVPAPARPYGNPMGYCGRQTAGCDERLAAEVGQAMGENVACGAPDARVDPLQTQTAELVRRLAIPEERKRETAAAIRRVSAEAFRDMEGRRALDTCVEAFRRLVRLEAQLGLR
ncbi:hypothetical protein [Muricoccus radiodurans]|uniref:hypothetical protein n=1 Tax=Muricoccus radiodurans TaxID=2231721 RepID=UPI003CED7CC4